MSGFVFDAYARTPQEIGAALADRMRGDPLPQFLKSLDDNLEQMRSLLLDEGFNPPAAFEICRAARQIAQDEWERGLNRPPDCP
jgi:hypothetical protein